MSKFVEKNVYSKNKTDKPLVTIIDIGTKNFFLRIMVYINEIFIGGTILGKFPGSTGVNWGIFSM